MCAPSVTKRDPLVASAVARAAGVSAVHTAAGAVDDTPRQPHVAVPAWARIGPSRPIAKLFRREREPADDELPDVKRASRRSPALASLALLAAICPASPAVPQTAPFGEVDHHVVRVDGVRFHYVTAGSGDPVVLLPGWPESWIAWRKVIPLLVKAGRQVYVLDPRGFGDSDKPQGGYDIDTAARDLHGFLAATGLNRPAGVDIVAHDVGTWIGHAHAVTYPGEVKRLVLTEAFVPGVMPPVPAAVPSEAANLKSWQFAFNRLDDLPEILVQGHERAYLAWVYATKSTRSYAIEPAALDEYVRVFSVPGGARAGFAWYRAAFSPEGVAQAMARAGLRLPMPVLALGGGDGIGDALRAALAPLGDAVKGGAIEGCGHFLPEECPDELAAAILAFWRETS